MKTGLFGGTFNPLHNGHLGIAAHVKQHFNLDRIYFIPSALPPHKPADGLVLAENRYEMVKKTVEPLDGFYVSNRELIRKGPSYTIDTINEFICDDKNNSRFFFMVGSDAFLEITTWKKNEQIFQTVPVIIMIRGDKKNTRRITRYIDEHISKGYAFDKITDSFVHENRQPIFICHVPRIDISSTMIREHIKKKRDITRLVPGPVKTIIAEKELYR